MHEKIMTPERILRDKLRKIEALFAGAATSGEKAAAGAAAERIRARLGQTATHEKSIELKFSIPDAWRGSCSSHYADVTACDHFAIGGCTVKAS